MTTAGYGDAVPVMFLGRIFAGFHTLAGLGLAAIFTGIVASASRDAGVHKRKND